MTSWEAAEGCHSSGECLPLDCVGNGSGTKVVKRNDPPSAGCPGGRSPIAAPTQGVAEFGETYPFPRHRIFRPCESRE